MLKKGRNSKFTRDLRSNRKQRKNRTQKKSRAQITNMTEKTSTTTGAMSDLEARAKTKVAMLRQGIEAYAEDHPVLEREFTKTVTEMAAMQVVVNEIVEDDAEAAVTYDF